MTTEITYIAIYVLGVSAGILFALVANGVDLEDFPWLQEKEYPGKDDPKSLSEQQTFTVSGSHFIFGIFKK